MKVKTLSALAGLGSAMILSTGARADLVANTGVNTSLSVEAVTSGGGAPPAGLPRTIYHVYANFTAGTDRVETWGIGGVNFGPGGATLGLRYANQGPVVGGSPTDAAGYSPGFPNFATGTSVPVPASGMAVFITPDDAQGAANWIDSGSDTSTRVLLMQLVVNTGDHVQGTIGLVWSGGALAGSQVASGLSFTTVPAPGALALLGLAGLVGSRRRRA
jgi:MYXO-CTERM domain-containing protein